MHASPAGQWMVDILALVLPHDEQAVLTAVQLALADGVLTKTHVLNLLHRLIDGKVIGGPPLDTPQALALHREPNRTAFMYSLIITAKMNDIDPQTWLADVLARMPALSVSRLPELLPWNWRDAPAKQKAA
jgi:IS66 C-terminal element